MLLPRGVVDLLVEPQSRGCGESRFATVFYLRDALIAADEWCSGLARCSAFQPVEVSDEQGFADGMR